NRPVVAETGVFLHAEELLVNLVEAGLDQDGAAEIEAAHVPADRGLEPQVIVSPEDDVARLRPDRPLDDQAVVPGGRSLEEDVAGAGRRRLHGAGVVGVLGDEDATVPARALGVAGADADGDGRRADADAAQGDVAGQSAAGVQEAAGGAGDAAAVGGDGNRP